ncbi:glutamate decarboxylase 2 isoform X1 [Hydra vulgaris]|uniref:glutamate decarboxylase 2 isoform X1 n=1 Tax=Hydra vulgaris TaxID=6087 RepID=UPI001F5F506E|nr:glutamate decarboxylase 2 isoform X1 [Hydra vulgaris]XP_047136818.1 glutamate decarboxylase 2 isoform X1 [Hydra vulgaris]
MATHFQPLNDDLNNQKSTKGYYDTKFHTDLLPNVNNSKDTESYINEFVKKLVSFLTISNNRNEKIIDFMTPEELMKLFDFSLPDSKLSLGDLLQAVDTILKFVVKTAHPRFFNQLWAGVDVNCLLGDWMASVTNTTMFTFEMSPVYILMEKFIVEKFLTVVGYENGDGFFFPGGSLSNMEAIVLARHKRCPNFKRTGYNEKKLVLFTSEEAHYSIIKSAAMIGIGIDNVIIIKTDERGKMVVSNLEVEVQKTIKNGGEPFCVCATAGTTVVGAFDPFNEIADVCEKYNLWMHIDACWGGASLLSKKHKHLMDGAHRADSISWNPHKMMNVLLQSSILLTKEKDLFRVQNSLNASYLFQKDKLLYDVSWDIGDNTFQCGRHNDILKLWLMWKAKVRQEGTSGIEEQIDQAFSNAKYLSNAIKNKENFKLLFEPESCNVCFHYIPPSLLSISDHTERTSRLSQVCPMIKKHMTLEGTLMINYQPLKEHCNFFRMITVNPAATQSDMDFVLEEIERLGKDL